MTAPTIFIVEDDVDTREMLGRFLEREGFVVRTAANGQQALEQLTGGLQVCVILLDLMMPVMDGWQFRREQSRLESVADVPVIVVSAVARDRLAEIDADAVIPKPVDLDELLKQITAHCAR